MEPDDDGLFHVCTPVPSRNPDGSEHVFRPEWRTETVIGLATGIADDKAFERMPILADALEEAGCDSASVLWHCREPIAHEDGCWVLGAILRRSPPAPGSELSTEAILQLLRDFQRRQSERRIMSPSTARLVRRFRRFVSLGCLIASLLLIVFFFTFVIFVRYLIR